MKPQCSTSFRPPRKGNYLVRITPPKVHCTPHITGGLKQLYEDIQLDEQHQKHAYGSYTSDEGVFCPEKGMPLLAKRYQFIDTIGKGQSAVLIKARDTFQGDLQVAVKVLHKHYHALGVQEMDCLRKLKRADPNAESATLRLFTTFNFDDHYCLVCELLQSKSLLNALKDVLDPKERINRVRTIAFRVLQALGFLRQQNVIHADLKPDNILLKKDNVLNSLKVIDFGNAIHCVHDELSLYYDDFELQTLMYRAPEVMFGVPFGMEIDMWSLGCILAELYMGQPMFRCRSKASLVNKMAALLGPIPDEPFKRGKFYGELISTVDNGRICSPHSNLMKMLDTHDCLFVDFLSGLFKLKPGERMTISQAAMHPFLTPEVGVRFLFTPGTTIEHEANSSVVLHPSLVKRPVVDTDVGVLCLSPVELLRHGTSLAEKKAALLRPCPRAALQNFSPASMFSRSPMDAPLTEKRCVAVGAVARALTAPREKADLGSPRDGHPTRTRHSSITDSLEHRSSNNGATLTKPLDTRLHEQRDIGSEDDEKRVITNKAQTPPLRSCSPGKQRTNGTSVKRHPSTVTPENSLRNESRPNSPRHGVTGTHPSRLDSSRSAVHAGISHAGVVHMEQATVHKKENVDGMCEGKLTVARKTCHVMPSGGGHRDSHDLSRTRASPAESLEKRTDVNYTDSVDRLVKGNGGNGASGEVKKYVGQSVALNGAHNNSQTSFPRPVFQQVSPVIKGETLKPLRGSLDLKTEDPDSDPWLDRRETHAHPAVLASSKLEDKPVALETVSREHTAKAPIEANNVKLKREFTAERKAQERSPEPPRKMARSTGVVVLKEDAPAVEAKQNKPGHPQHRTFSPVGCVVRKTAERNAYDIQTARNPNSLNATRASNMSSLDLNETFTYFTLPKKRRRQEEMESHNDEERPLEKIPVRRDVVTHSVPERPVRGRLTADQTCNTGRCVVSESEPSPVGGRSVQRTPPATLRPPVREPLVKRCAIPHERADQRQGQIRGQFAAKPDCDISKQRFLYGDKLPLDSYKHYDRKDESHSPEDDSDNMMAASEEDADDRGVLGAMDAAYSASPRRLQAVVPTPSAREDKGKTRRVATARGHPRVGRTAKRDPNQTKERQRVNRVNKRMTHSKAAVCLDQQPDFGYSEGSSAYDSSSEEDNPPPRHSAGRHLTLTRRKSSGFVPDPHRGRPEGRHSTKPQMHPAGGDNGRGRIEARPKKAQPLKRSQGHGAGSDSFPQDDILVPDPQPRLSRTPPTKSKRRQRTPQGPKRIHNSHINMHHSRASLQHLADASQPGGRFESVRRAQSDCDEGSGWQSDVSTPGPSSVMADVIGSDRDSDFSDGRGSDSAFKGPGRGSDSAFKGPGRGSDSAFKGPGRGSDSAFKGPGRGSDSAFKGPGRGSDSAFKGPGQTSEGSFKRNGRGSYSAFKETGRASDSAFKSPGRPKESTCKRKGRGSDSAFKEPGRSSDSSGIVSGRRSVSNDVLGSPGPRGTHGNGYVDGHRRTVTSEYMAADDQCDDSNSPHYDVFLL